MIAAKMRPKYKHDQSPPRRDTSNAEPSDGEPSWRRHRCVAWHPYLQAGAGQLTACEAREVFMVPTTLVGGGLQRAMVVCNSARRVVMLVPRARSNKGTNNGSNSGMTISSRLLLCPLSTATRPAAEASGDETKEGSEVVHRPVRDVVVVGAGVAGRWESAAISEYSSREACHSGRLQYTRTFRSLWANQPRSRTEQGQHRRLQLYVSINITSKYI